MNENQVLPPLLSFLSFFLGCDLESHSNITIITKDHPLKRVIKFTLNTVIQVTVFLVTGVCFTASVREIIKQDVGSAAYQMLHLTQAFSFFSIIVIQGTLTFSRTCISRLRQTLVCRLTIRKTMTSHQTHMTSFRKLINIMKERFMEIILSLTLMISLAESASELDDSRIAEWTRKTLWFNPPLGNQQSVPLAIKITVWVIHMTHTAVINRMWLIISLMLYDRFVSLLQRLDVSHLESMNSNHDWMHDTERLKRFLLCRHLIRENAWVRFETLFNFLPFFWFSKLFVDFSAVIVLMQSGVLLCLRSFVLHMYLVNSVMSFWLAWKMTTFQEEKKRLLNLLLISLEWQSRMYVDRRVRCTVPNVDTRTSQEDDEKSVYLELLIRELSPSCALFDLSGYRMFTLDRNLIITFVESLVSITVIFLQLSGNLRLNKR